MLRTGLKISGILQRPSKKGQEARSCGRFSFRFLWADFHKEADDLEGIYACPGLRSKSREMELVLVTS